MITREFDVRTFAAMEYALQEACKLLPDGGNGHEIRSYIAARILECVRSGDKTLYGVVHAARRAALECYDSQADQAA